MPNKINQAVLNTSPRGWTFRPVAALDRKEFKVPKDVKWIAEHHGLVYEYLCFERKIGAVLYCDFKNAQSKAEDAFLQAICHA